MRNDGWRKVDKSLLQRLARDPKLTRSAFRVLCFALLRETDPGVSIPLAARFVAEHTGLSRRSVQDALALLQGLGYLIRCGQGEDGTLTYTVQPGEADPATPSEADPATCTKHTRPPRAKQTRPIRRPNKKTIKKTGKKQAKESAANEILAAYANVRPPAIDTSRGRAKGHLVKLLAKHSKADLLAAVENYGTATHKTDPQYRRGAGNFFGKDADFEDYLPGNFEVIQQPVLKAQADDLSDLYE